MAEKFVYKDIRNKDHSRFFLIQFFFVGCQLVLNHCLPCDTHCSWFVLSLLQTTLLPPSACLHMSFADDMARLLSLYVVKGEEVEELADLWAGGGHESEAFVNVILGEMTTVETMLGFLAEHLQDNLQDSVVVAAGRVALWQLKMHVELGFVAPQSPARLTPVVPFCQFRPELARMPVGKKLSSVRLSELQSAYHTFQEALRIFDECDPQLLECNSWRRLLQPCFALAADWLPHFSRLIPRSGVSG